MANQMTTWHVAAQFAEELDNAGDLTDLINALADDFLDELDGHSSVVTGSPEEPNGVARYGASLSIEAESAGDAAIRGAALVTAAAKRVGLPQLPLVRIEIVDEAELDRELEVPTYPNILGVSELAHLLGVTRQRASELARSKKFAEPLAVLASGPIWLESSIQRFVKEWTRRPGRPRNPVISQLVSTSKVKPTND